MPVNIKKCHILQVGTGNLKYDYEISGKLKSVHRVKYLGVMIVSNLKLSQQCKDAAGKANRMPGFIKRNFSFKNKDITVERGDKRDRGKQRWLHNLLRIYLS